MEELQVTQESMRLEKRRVEQSNRDLTERLTVAYERIRQALANCSPPLADHQLPSLDLSKDLQQQGANVTVFAMCYTLRCVFSTSLTCGVCVCGFACRH